MTPEVQALIARVRELEVKATQEGLTQPMGDELADAALQLATALEAAEKRADAEKKRGDQMEQTASAFSNLMMNCADTLRSRGIDAAVGPLDIRVIELAKRADAAEAKLKVAREGMPSVVCLCGSSKHPELHMRAMMDETLAGRIVVPMGLYGHADFPAGAKAATNDGDESTAVKQMLDTLHHRKIDLADEVLVLTVDGYIGNSTRREIEYAERTGKPVRFSDTAVAQLTEPETESK